MGKEPLRKKNGERALGAKPLSKKSAAKPLSKKSAAKPLSKKSAAKPQVGLTSTAGSAPNKIKKLIFFSTTGSGSSP